jgi:uncharacterized membrane protein YfcA
MSSWSTWQWVLGAIAVMSGAFVQGSVGFGYALVAAPLLTLVSRDLVPGPVLASSCVLSAGIALRERRFIDRRIVGWALVGRVPGVWLGALAVTLVSDGMMDLLFGASVLLAVVMSVTGYRIEPTTRVLLGTGLVSGVMGTISAIGGPPIALLNQHQTGPALRATLCMYFTVGAILSMLGLALVDRFGARELYQSALMLPPMAAGFLLAEGTRGILKLLALAHDGARILRIVPEVGIFGACVQFLEADGGVIPVKDASAAA